MGQGGQSDHYGIIHCRSFEEVKLQKKGETFRGTSETWVESNFNSKFGGNHSRQGSFDSDSTNDLSGEPNRFSESPDIGYFIDPQNTKFYQVSNDQKSCTADNDAAMSFHMSSDSMNEEEMSIGGNSSIITTHPSFFVPHSDVQIQSLSGK